jgi:hypothetical protein
VHQQGRAGNVPKLLTDVLFIVQQNAPWLKFVKIKNNFFLVILLSCGVILSPNSSPGFSVAAT